MLCKFEPVAHPWTLRSYYSAALEALQVDNYAHAACLLLYLCYHFPDFFTAKFKLGLAQMKLGYWQGAQRSFEDLVSQRDPDVLCNLGICHWQQQEIKQALRYFKYTVAHFPHHVETRENLAQLYLTYQRNSKAIAHYQDILHLYPKRRDIRFNLAACYQKQGLLQAAIHEYRHILTEDPKAYSSLYNLGSIYYSLEETKAAEFYWQQCLKLKPRQEELIFLLKRLQHLDFSSGEYQAYVKHNFENYALTYNSHLSQTLNYQLPTLLKYYAEQQFKPQQFISTLELGCGTGLCGLWLKTYSQNLCGVDLSANMLAKAEQLKVYDSLENASIQDFLQICTQTFDFIILVDVIPYIDDLSSLFAIIKPHLSSKAHFLLTTELSQVLPRELQANSRFSYHPEYIQHLAQNYQLDLIHMFEVKAREENQMPVITGIYHWQNS